MHAFHPTDQWVAIRAEGEGVSFICLSGSLLFSKTNRPSTDVNFIEEKIGLFGSGRVKELETRALCIGKWW